MTKRVYVIGHYAFVPHPSARGLWLRTDLSVLVKCPATKCGQPAGLPCIGPSGHVSYSHHARREVARKVKARTPDLVVTVHNKARRR